MASVPTMVGVDESIAPSSLEARGSRRWRSSTFRPSTLNAPPPSPPYLLSSCRRAPVLYAEPSYTLSPFPSPSSSSTDPLIPSTPSPAPPRFSLAFSPHSIPSSLWWASSSSSLSHCHQKFWNSTNVEYDSWFRVWSVHELVRIESMMLDDSRNVETKLAFEFDLLIWRCYLNLSLKILWC